MLGVRARSRHLGGRGSLALAMVGVAASLFSGTALAQSHGVTRLRYSRDTTASACRDENALRGAVAERIGYEPFRESARTAIVVALFGEGDILHAHVELRDEHDEIVGKRDLQSDDPSCSDLFDTTALTITILLDTPVVRRASEAPPPAPPPAPAPSPKTRELGYRLGAGGVLGLGVAPKVSGGLFLAAGISYARYSLDVEGRIDFSTEKSYAEGSGETALRLVQLAPCIHISWALGCVIGGAGVLSVDGRDLATAEHHSSLFALAGVRGGVELPIAGPIAARATADVQVPLTRTTLTIGADDVWTTAPVTAAFSLGILGKFQ